MLLAPWLAILALLGLKPNRRLTAGWIIAPLGFIILFTTVFPWTLSSPIKEIVEAADCLAAGLAVAWLMAERLSHRRRGLFFLCLVMAMGAAGIWVFAWGHSGNGQASIPVALVSLLAILASVLSFNFCGRICRHGYRRAKCYLGLLVLLPIIWFLLFSPLIIYSLIIDKNIVHWLEVAWVISACAAVNYATILPFLILSTANAFYHQRLLALLQLPIQSSSLTEVNLKYLIPEITKPQE